MSTHPKHVTWMGGSVPRPYPEVAGSPEGAYVARLFQDEVNVWESHWGDKCAVDMRKVFWGRARYDAHATYRDAGS